MHAVYTNTIIINCFDMSFAYIHRYTWNQNRNQTNQQGKMVRILRSRKSLLSVIVTLFLLLSMQIMPAKSGILGLIAGFFGGYGACQTACNAGWVSCYAAAGLTAGTVTAGAAMPAAAIACNAAQGVCMASCAAAFLAA